MRRFFGWTLVGGLFLAMASPATAQFSITFGNPYRGTGTTFGNYSVTPSYTYGNPALGSLGNDSPYATVAPRYGYPATYGVTPGYGVVPVMPGYAYGNPALGSASRYGYPGTSANPGYGSAYSAARNPAYSSAYSGYAYPSSTTYTYRSYSSGYGPTYKYPSYGSNFSGYGYPLSGVGPRSYIIRVR